ncbi:orotidine-5'-phosphate decarboxylase [Acetomicrobium sp. S15 = DSM 107314]|jgi:orotidine-5'-phosphate decarboxylase|uniref:orotidine-5'-phosphate decarboxylase n=1 Tax=Acetomicrobium sp. S15 = DSM 107314 TaxID=2529858 RepID=UPI0018E16936|nr:orotidine-5'-phosphate decarboxylase [Acetomicrobium sp. S15 = DSM 107314]
MKDGPSLILALDLKSLDEVEMLLSRVGDMVEHIKIGPRLLLSGGPQWVASLASKWRVFLDLKLHDIPNTVRGAVEALCNMGIWAVTVHIAGGRDMMSSAIEARSSEGPLLFGVTILTSLDEAGWRAVSPGSSMDECLKARASLAAEVGLDGVVCAPTDLPSVRTIIGSRCVTVVPGIRFAPHLDDQRRTSHPSEAVRMGGDFLVVGRPILESPDPRSAIDRIKEEMEEGWRCRKADL